MMNFGEQSWHVNLPSVAPPQLANPIDPDPVAFSIASLGFTPDPIQADVLRSQSRRVILCMGRRCGKTWVTSAKIVHFALTHPGSEILVFSASQRQADILLWNARGFLASVGMARRGDGLNRKSVILSNGARIISLPPQANTVVGFTPAMVVLDEAARIPDSLYHAISPMLGLHDPTLILLSTPNGRRGFFYKEWSSTESWQRFFAPTTECARYSQEFLEQQRRSLPEIIFRQDYACEFLDASGAYFPEALLDRALDSSLDPYYTAASEPTSQVLNAYPSECRTRDFFLGLDLGQSQDYTALTVLERLELVSLERDPYSLTFPTSVQHRIRHLERLPLQTAYHQVVAKVIEWVEKLSRAAKVGHVELVVDATAVGTPIVEMLRNARPACTIVPVIITGSEHGSFSGEMYRVPKRDLMSRLHLMLEDNALRIPFTLPALPDFREEFRAFRLRFTSTGHDSYSAEGLTHDDLILSVALATWRSWR